MSKVRTSNSKWCELGLVLYDFGLAYGNDHLAIVGFYICVL